MWHALQAWEAVALQQIRPASEENISVSNITSKTKTSTSQISDSAPSPVLPPGGSATVYAMGIDPCYSLLSHYCVAYSWPLKHDVIHRTGSTLHIAKSLNEDRAPATGNTHKNCDAIKPAYTDMLADRQTDRHGHYNTLLGRSNYKQILPCSFGCSLCEVKCLVRARP